MRPKVDPSCFVHETAVIVGNVELAAGCSVWPHAVIRADIATIYIGEGSNVQDNAIVHCSKGFPVRIGKDVSVGHSCIVHGATIGDRVIVGMHATVMNGATIGEGSIIGANALVKEGMVVPPKSLVLGIPGKVVRSEDGSLAESALGNARNYHALRDQHKRGEFAPYRAEGGT
ncbi:MAG: gamma carbonic anhydrase family protein [Euryarchaeota archaeon]|nr:gamma carbonic anhydrase family protein [Euryarchaeota archaeon]